MLTILIHIFYILLYEYMDQYCKRNWIPLSAHFIYLNLDSILA